MSQHPILIIEDDFKLQQAISETLQLSGYQSVSVNTAEEGMKEIDQSNFSMIISDVNLGQGMNGLEFLEKVTNQQKEIPILIITAFASIEDAVLAMQRGAIDYLVKPFVPERLISLVQRYSVSSLPLCEEPIAVNEKMKQVLEMAKRVAKTKVTVLLTGESGTGKEVLAKYIHKKSNVSDGPFVAINCAAIPDNMLEAMLFGHEKGAFTGAYQASAGKFELAQDGTLLLDEVSEMPLVLQAKLLRVIQEREVERLGGKKSIPLNIRIIAATNKSLREAVKENKFREDLYFRLSVFPIQIPALHQRTEDIIPLAEVILQSQCQQENRNGVVLSESAKKHLLQRKWPGNIRELENVLQRAIILQTSDELSVDDLSVGDFEEITFVGVKEQFPSKELDSVLKDKEYTMILKVLKENQGCRQSTAEILGISTRTLRHKIAKMRESGLDVPEIKKLARGDNQ